MNQIVTFLIILTFLIIGAIAFLILSDSLSVEIVWPWSNTADVETERISTESVKEEGADIKDDSVEGVSKSRYDENVQTSTFSPETTDIKVITVSGVSATRNLDENISLAYKTPVLDISDEIVNEVHPATLRQVYKSVTDNRLAARVGFVHRNSNGPCAIAKAINVIGVYRVDVGRYEIFFDNVNVDGEDITETGVISCTPRGGKEARIIAPVKWSNEKNMCGGIGSMTLRCSIAKTNADNDMVGKTMGMTSFICYV
jgi:hypothetical protein